MSRQQPCFRVPLPCVVARRSAEKRISSRASRYVHGPPSHQFLEELARCGVLSRKRAFCLDLSRVQKPRSGAVLALFLCAPTSR